MRGFLLLNMKLKTINIKDLYCFHHTKINLCPGVNVIFGPTNSGKRHLEYLINLYSYSSVYAYISTPAIKPIYVKDAYSGINYSLHRFSKQGKVNIKDFKIKFDKIIYKILGTPKEIENYYSLKDEETILCSPVKCYLNVFDKLLVDLLRLIINVSIQHLNYPREVKLPPILISSSVFDQLDLISIRKLMKLVRFLGANGAQVFIFCTHLTSIRQLWLELKDNTNIPYRFISLVKNKTYRTTVSESDDINSLEWDNSILDEQCKQDEQLLEIFSQGI